MNWKKNHFNKNCLDVPNWRNILLSRYKKFHPLKRVDVAHEGPQWGHIPTIWYWKFDVRPALCVQRDRILIFSPQILQNYWTDLDYFSEMIGRDLNLTHFLNCWCRHFRFRFIAHFVKFNDLFCAERISETIINVTMKFSGKVNKSVKLCPIKLFYASIATSWSALGH